MSNETKVGERRSQVANRQRVPSVIPDRVRGLAGMLAPAASTIACSILSYRIPPPGNGNMHGQAAQEEAWVAGILRSASEVPWNSTPPPNNLCGPQSSRQPQCRPMQIETMAGVPLVETAELTQPNAMWKVLLGGPVSADRGGL